MSEVASPAATLGPGTHVGNYVVDRKIGEGGMGAVYMATHPHLGRKAAIKVLLPEHSKQPDLVTRFFNEAKTAANLRHPALVEVFDFGFLPNGAGYLVMDLLQGESLAARLASVGRLPAATAIDIGRQIAAGVAAAHGQGIVHRDLKPDNVFLVPDPEFPGRERVKILDFGIAKLVLPNASLSQGSKAVRTSTGMLLGTPLFMAPEQCRGSGQVDHRADIYSVGCILFMMLTGRPPFNHEGVGEVLAAHLHEPPPSPRSLEPSVPAALEAVVMRALQKAPEARFQTMAELGAELQRSFTAPAVSSASAEVPAQGRGAMIAVVLLVAAGAAGGGIWWLKRRPPAPAVAVAVVKSTSAPGAAGGTAGAHDVRGGQLAAAAQTSTGAGTDNPGSADRTAAPNPPAAAATAAAKPQDEEAAPGSAGVPPGSTAPPAGTGTEGAETEVTAPPADHRRPGARDGRGGRAGAPGGHREPVDTGHKLFDRGMDLRARGDEAGALLTFRAALSSGLVEPEKSNADRQVLMLRKKFGELEVICDLEGAEVAIDGTVQGRTPLRRPLLMKPGRHTLTITRPGYRTIMREITLGPGEREARKFTVAR